MKAPLVFFLLVGLLGVFATLSHEELEQNVASASSHNEMIEMLEKHVESIKAAEKEGVEVVPANIQKIVKMFDSIITRIQNEGNAARQVYNRQSSDNNQRVASLTNTINSLNTQLNDGTRQATSFNERINALQITLKNLDATIAQTQTTKKNTEDRVALARNTFNNRKTELELAKAETQDLITLFGSISSQLNQVTLVETDSKAMDNVKATLAEKSNTENSRVKSMIEMAQVAVEVAAAGPKADTREVQSVLDKLRAEMEAYLKQLENDLNNARNDYNNVNAGLSAQVASLENQLVLRSREKAGNSNEIASLRTRLTDLEKNGRDISGRIAGLRSELAAVQSSSKTLQERFNTEDAERTRQIQLLQKLKSLLTNKDLRSQMTALKVDSVEIGSKDFEFAGNCDGTGNWANGRWAEYMDRLGGTVNVLARCPNFASPRGIKINNCGAGLNLKFSCTPAPNVQGLVASEYDGGCDSGNWGAGTAATIDNFARIGGGWDQVAFCPTGAYLSGFGVVRCNYYTSLRIRMSCVRVEQRHEYENIDGPCDESNERWATGTPNLGVIGRTPKAECPVGTYTAGLGLKRCGNGTFRLSLRCIRYL